MFLAVVFEHLRRPTPIAVNWKSSTAIVIAVRVFE